MADKKNILVLFDGQHLAFSPTVTQLYDMLSVDHTVTILTESSTNFIKEKLTGRNVIDYQVIRKKPTFIYKVYYFLLAAINNEAKYLRKNKIKFPEYYYRYRLTKKLLESGIYNKVIAVDIKNLFYCTLLKQQVDFLSLEIGMNEKLLPHIDISLMNAVIIQSRERLDYLFPGQNFKTYYIQNSPVFKEINIPAQKNGLLYGGTAWNAFGFYHCLEYLKAYKEETLTVQGSVPLADKKKIHKLYKELLQEKRLIINDSYLDNDEVVNYFSQFEIGFCFYNFDMELINHFNYRSAPSGKLFKYLAAGVPVVAIDITGFAFVRDLKCGVLVPDLSPEKIRDAIVEIRNNYLTYADNAIAAAKQFSFEKMAQPYIDYVKNELQ